MVDENGTAENSENSEQLSDDDGSDVHDQNQTTNEPRTRYGRAIKPHDILTYSHHQDNPKQPEKIPKQSVKFVDDEWHQLEQQHNLFVSGAQLANKMECGPQLALVAARFIDEIKAKVNQQGASFAQQYVLHKGLKRFEEKGNQGARKEADQLHRSNCVRPVDVASLTLEGKRKAAEALMLLSEKRTFSTQGN